MRIKYRGIVRDFFQDMVTERRARPRDDAISTLLRAEIEGEKYAVRAGGPRQRHLGRRPGVRAPDLPWYIQTLMDDNRDGQEITPPPAHDNRGRLAGPFDSACAEVSDAGSPPRTHRR